MVFPCMLSCLQYGQSRVLHVLSSNDDIQIYDGYLARINIYQFEFSLVHSSSNLAVKSIKIINFYFSKCMIYYEIRYHHHSYMFKQTRGELDNLLHFFPAIIVVLLKINSSPIYSFNKISLYRVSLKMYLRLLTILIYFFQI